MRAGADAVADRVRGLARVACVVQLFAHLPVELGHRRPGPDVLERAVVHVHERGLQLGVLRLQLAHHEILGVVGPVTVGADPDLEQDGLALDHGQVAGGGEGLDPAARPDERERKRELDLAVVARPLAVHEALPERGDLRLPHPRAEQLADVVHRRCRELVRQPQAL